MIHKEGIIQKKTNEKTHKTTYKSMLTKQKRIKKKSTPGL